jgi:hypothetical protein
MIVGLFEYQISEKLINCMSKISLKKSPNIVVTGRKQVENDLGNIECHHRLGLQTREMKSAAHDSKALVTLPIKTGAHKRCVHLYGQFGFGAEVVTLIGGSS